MKLSKRLVFVFIRTKFKVLSAISKRAAAREAFKLFCTPLLKLKRKYPASLANEEDLSFYFNGQKVFGRRWNHPQQIRALLLHGFSSAAYNFERYVKPLTGKDYEVLAFDAPAHGLSGGKRINAVNYAALIREVVRLYGPFDSYISHSFGGLALCLAMEELPHSKNDKLVLIAPATETTSAIDGAFKMLGLSDIKVRKEFDNIILKMSGKPTSWFSVNRAIRNIRATILWIHDTEDSITPYKDAESILINQPANVRFRTTNGLGHRNIYRDPVIIKEITDFL